jgi:hypothetical protein
VAIVQFGIVPWSAERVYNDLSEEAIDTNALRQPVIST